MISGNKNSTNHDHRNRIFSVSASAVFAAATASSFVSSSAYKHLYSLAKGILLKKEPDYHKATKPIYGAAAVVNHKAQFAVCSSAHNIAMLVEMLASGVPFVGWRVKPDPGD